VDGADDTLLAAAVADRLAGRLDPAGQGGLAHEPAAPELVQQLGLGDEPAAVADQVGQDLEDLRLQVAGDAAAAQLVAALVELAVAEPVDHPAASPRFLHPLSKVAAPPGATVTEPIACVRSRR
jgi:hypothetical protein